MLATCGVMVPGKRNVIVSAPLPARHCGYGPLSVVALMIALRSVQWLMPASGPARLSCGPSTSILAAWAASGMNSRIENRAIERERERTMILLLVWAVF